MVPRLFLSWSRVELLIGEYQRLYGHARLKDLPWVLLGDRPRVLLQCASLTTGRPCTFGRSGFITYPERDGVRGLRIPRDQEVMVEGGTSAELEVAFAVAASSAFPPLFPPVVITERHLRTDAGRLIDFPLPQHLSDGGIFDNLGIDRPLWFYREEQENENDRLDGFFVSDAEGHFEQERGLGLKFKFIVPRSYRATNLLMKRLATFTWIYLKERNDPTSLRFASANISRETECGLSRAAQRAIKGIRTDLDRFSDLEVECLVQHGYATAREELIREKWVGADAPNKMWCPVKRHTLQPGERTDRLREAHRRRLLPLVWPYREPLTWLLRHLRRRGRYET